jgi:hypothetical protein
LKIYFYLLTPAQVRELGIDLGDYEDCPEDSTLVVVSEKGIPEAPLGTLLEPPDEEE